MKRVAYSLILVMLFSVTGQAADRFPEFRETRITVEIPREDLQVFQADPAHETEEERFRYSLIGQFFSVPEAGHIQTLDEGFSGNPTDRSTPWRTLTELLANYQRGDLEAVNALYDDDSLAYIEQALADPARKQMYLEMMSKVAGMDVLLGFQHKGGFLAMVNVHFDLGDQGIQTEIQPVFFIKNDSHYQVSRVVLDEAIDKNISIYLKDHSVQELAALAVYTLTVEKGGTGSGDVVGSGIDCGQTCTQVYYTGTMIYLKAIPDEDSEFVQWIEDGQPLRGRITMTRDMTVTAIFDRK